MEYPLTDDWFVLRDLTRPNAKRPAYRLLEEKGIEIFTPMRWRLVERKGKRIREEVPLLHDLLFAHTIIRKSKFPPNPERSVQFSGKRTKRSVQKKGCTQHL